MTTTSITGQYCIGTDSGKTIDLLNPDPASIDIKDIANALSNICRFNGHVKEFYSVARHAILVTSLVPKELKLQALLHDASEAYICDIPTPLKNLLGHAYAVIEDRMQDAIGKAFGVDLLNLSPLVKQADRIMVVSERDTKQSVPRKWSAEYENTLRYPVMIANSSPTRDREDFIFTFNKYKKTGV